MNYPVFAIQPNFKKLPGKKAISTIDLLTLSDAEVFGQFPSLKDDLTVIYQFAGSGEVESQEILGFWNKMGGRKGWFLMPSWEQDFSLGEQQEGDEELVLTAEVLPTPSTPDEPGAWLYIYEENAFFAAKVMKKEGSVYTLDRPLTFTPTSAALCGWMRLARFDADDIAPRWIDAFHMEVELPVTFTRVANKAERSGVIDAPAVRSWLQPVGYKQEPLTEVRTRFDHCKALGPANYGAQVIQSTTVSGDTEYVRPSVEWRAWIGQDGVYFGKVPGFDVWNVSDSAGQKSLLPRFKPNKYDHLAFCFDEQGKEVLALCYESRVVLHGYDGNDPFRIGFDGDSPQLLQAWCLQNEALDLSDAEVLCVYMKKAEAALFYRAESEGFETERILCPLPGVPVKIESIVTEGATAKVICWDDGYRKITLEFNCSYSTQPNTAEITEWHFTTTEAVTFDTTATILTAAVNNVTTINSHTTAYIGETIFNTETTTFETGLTEVISVIEVIVTEATTDGFGNPTMMPVTVGFDVTENKTTIRTVIVVMPTTRATAKNRVTYETEINEVTEEVIGITYSTYTTANQFTVVDNINTTYRTTQ